VLPRDWLYPIGRGPKEYGPSPFAGMPRKAALPAKHPVLKRLGVRIRHLRLQRGMSQETLADAAGIGRSYMSGIERGVRNCSTLHLIPVRRHCTLRLGISFRTRSRGFVTSTLPPSDPWRC